MRRRERATLTAAVAFVACPLFAEGQPLGGQQSALSLLDSVRVEVQLIGEAESTGLTSATIRESVENRLRDSPVSVREADDRSERGDPRLRVAVQAVKAAGGFAFLVSVQLVERVVTYRKYAQLVFDGALPTPPTASIEPLEISPAIKWEAQALGTTSRAGAATFIPNALLRYVDRFVEDYRAAN
jgi:hypothetical protein